MFNRHVELVGEGESESLLDAVGDLGIGVIVFSPLAQGLLTGRYLSGKVPEGSRATHGQWLNAENITATYWPGPGPWTRSRSSEGSRWPSSPSPGCCATRGSRRR